MSGQSEQLKHFKILGIYSTVIKIFLNYKFYICMNTFS